MEAAPLVNETMSSKSPQRSDELELALDIVGTVRGTRRCSLLGRAGRGGTVVGSSASTTAKKNHKFMNKEINYEHLLGSGSG